MDNKQYYDEKFDEIPKEFLNSCVSFLQNYFEDGELVGICTSIEEDGLVEWAIPYHYGWGMHIRNLLRQNGFTDDKLPDGNWDDYYIQVIECVVGCR